MTHFLFALLLVTGLVIGNWLWLRPSAAERALVAQRAHAGRLGVRALLRVAPDWLALAPGQRLLAHYHVPAALPAGLRGRWRWHAGPGCWQPVGDDGARTRQAPWPTPAPAGWEGVEVRAAEVIVYWREDGREATVDAMLATIGASAA